MKILAQIDKQTPNTGENLRFCIMAPDNKPVEISLIKLKKLLLHVSDIFSHRMEIINRVFIEDSGYLENLSQTQRDQFDKAFDALYTCDNDQLNIPLDENMKFQLSKQVGPQETYTIELSCFTPDDDLADTIFSALDIFDTRMLDQNIKEINHAEVIESLPFGDKMPLQMIFDTLFGRADPNTVAARLHGHKLEQEEKQNNDM